MLQLSMFFLHTNEKLALHPEHKVSFLLTFTNQEEGLLWLESRVGMNQKSKQSQMTFKVSTSLMVFQPLLLRVAKTHF